MPTPLERKQLLRDLFTDYDYHLKHMLAISARIKEEAALYWKEQGYTVLPRLERLRESVFATNEEGGKFCPDCDDPLSDGLHGSDCPRSSMYKRS